MEQNPYAAPSVDPTATRQTAVSTGPEDWTIGSALSAGWQAFKDNALVMIGGLIVMAVILYGVVFSTMFSFMPMSLLTPGAQPDPSQLQELMANMGTMMVVIFLVILPLEAFLFIGWFRLCLAAIRGDDVSIGMLFSGASRLLPVILAMIAVYILSYVGLILLIIPGIIISLGLSLVLPILADTEAGAIQSLSESWEAMKGHKMHFFGFAIVATIIYLIGAIVTLYLGLLIILPVLTLAFCEIYVCITGRRQAQA